MSKLFEVPLKTYVQLILEVLQVESYLQFTWGAGAIHLSNVIMNFIFVLLEKGEWKTRKQFSSVIVIKITFFLIKHCNYFAYNIIRQNLPNYQHNHVGFGRKNFETLGILHGPGTRKNRGSFIFFFHLVKNLPHSG